MNADTLALRARNEETCRGVLAKSELLDTTDLDWDRVGATDLDDDALASLVYMRDVEGFTTRPLVGFIAHHNTVSDPLLSEFLEIWRAEEAEHSRALDRFLDLYSGARATSVPGLQPPPGTDLSLSERVGVVMTRPIGQVVTAMHMVWGALNELLTLNGYRLLAAKGGDPVLAELLKRIAAQETRHFSFYVLQAEWRLAASRAARVLIPRLLRRSWTPVGVGTDFKEQHEFDRLAAYLVEGPRGQQTLRRMDATISRLPGLDGVRPFAGLVATA